MVIGLLGLNVAVLPDKLLWFRLLIRSGDEMGVIIVVW